MTTHYVLGFMFSNCDREVVLIEKKRPEWQAGHLNGVGGHIESTDANPGMAMAREFSEETGLYHNEWAQFGTITGPDYIVHLFRAWGRLDDVRSRTDEQVCIVEVEDALRNRLTSPIIRNLHILIPAALDPKVVNLKLFYK